MAQNQRRTQYQKPASQFFNRSPEAVDPKITGTWSSPDTDLPVDAEIVENETEVEEEPQTQPSDFVRILHNQVGRYPRGSVLPVSAFEHLENLLNLGALEYDYTATAEHIEGNQEHMASVDGVGQVVLQTIPNAPWISAAAHNLLGATYVSIASSTRAWTPVAEPAVVIPMGDDRRTEEVPIDAPAATQVQHSEVASY